MFTISNLDDSPEASDADRNVVGRSVKTPEPPETPSKRSSNPLRSPFMPPSKRKSGQQTGDRYLREGINFRFIPERASIESDTHYMLHKESYGSPTKNKRRTENSASDMIKDEADRIYSQVLLSELFGSSYAPQPAASASQSGTLFKSPTKSKILSFSSPTKLKSARKLDFTLNPSDQKFSTSEMSMDAQKTLLSPRKAPRHIPKAPFKVLDAPELADDFYLNVVDWGSNNVLGVGLGSCVYLWSACTSRVTKLCDLGPYDSIASVNWIQRGSHLAIGTNRGLVQLWDATQCKKIRTMSGHTARVGALAWNDHVLTSGSRDRTILHRDVRSPDHFIKKLAGHKQEVCGLRWNVEDNQLASGGNDNRLFVWDRMAETPKYRFSGHSAAVKAIAWSPHQRGLLASGGGTADRKIRFWNTVSGTPLQCVDTGSQVCNLQWSKNSNEIVSTHGYSQNQIVVWKYPSMQQLANLTGHTYRVLYLSMSPDGQTVVTGAGDETLRFWNVFNKSKDRSDASGILGPTHTIR